MSNETIDPPRMKLTLHRFTVAELQAVICYSVSRIEAGNLASTVFHDWLTDVCCTELVRRDTLGAEPEMPTIPTTLRPVELAAFLEGVFALSRAAMTASIGAFVDELELHVMVCVSSYLEQLDSCWEAVS